MDQFEESVIKPNEMLNVDDYKVILENKEKWNDEEKERFSTLTEQGFEAQESAEPETPAEPEVAEPETPVEVSPQEVSEIDTKKEIDEYVEQKKKELAEAGATKEEQKEAGEQIIEFWKYSKTDDGKLFIPKENSPVDWNHAFTNFLTYLKQNPDILAKDLAPRIREQIGELNSKDNERLQEINQGYDKELNSLYKQGKIPEPTSDEGREIDYKLSTLAVKYGLSSMTEAYDLWTKISPEQGGGFGYKPGQAKAEPEQKKEAVNMQKKLASKVSGGGGGTPMKQEGARTYKDLHNTSLDKILENEL